MSSPNHPTSEIEDVFSSNFPDYIPASPNYVPASSGKTYSSSSNNSFGVVPIVSPTLSLFHDDPYMKVMHAYYAKESPIPPPTIVPPSLMLSLMFNPQEFFLSYPIVFCFKLSLRFASISLRFAQDLTAFCLKTILHFDRKGKENGLQILQSIDQGPFELGTTSNTLGTTPKGGVLLGPERPRTYEDLSDTEKKRYDADVRATNIVLQGLPKDIYKLINHNIEAKAIWDNVKMLLRWF
ncbi:hypothetical protein Tco_0835470 [Tanacetum coccineum]